MTTCVRRIWLNRTASARQSALLGCSDLVALFTAASGAGLADHRTAPRLCRSRRGQPRPGRRSGARKARSSTLAIARPATPRRASPTGNAWAAALLWHRRSARSSRPTSRRTRIDGIGRWRTIDLANALMSGVSPRGEHLYPALPYTSYAHMRVEDVKDLMAYLRTLPAVPGQAPAHDLPFPFTIRRLVGFWKFLYLDRSPIQPDPARDRSLESRAAIWWKPLATAPNATPLGTCWARSSRRAGSPAVKTRRASALCPTSRQPGLETGAARISSRS